MGLIKSGKSNVYKRQICAKTCSECKYFGSLEGVYFCFVYPDNNKPEFNTGEDRPACKEFEQF